MIQSLATATALATILTAGCAHVQGAFESLTAEPKDLDKRDVEAALAAKDGARLEKMCADKTATRTYDGQHGACLAKSTLALSQLPDADCDTAEKTIGWASLEDAKDMVPASLKMAKCGRWDVAFTMLIHRDDGGPEALVELTKQGYDIEKEFMAFLQRHADKPLAFEHSFYTAQHVTAWLQKNRPADHCSAYIPYVAKMEQDPQVMFFSYFTETKCKPAAKMISASLASDNRGSREAACAALAVLGDASYLNKLQLLASTDPDSVVRTLERGGDTIYVKAYPVREACSTAVNKLTLRAEQ